MTININDAVNALVSDLGGDTVDTTETNSEVNEETEVDTDETSADEQETGEDVDETSEEEDSEESDEEEETETPEVIDLTDDQVVRINGREVNVGEALLREDDYTKKTQALAEQSRAIEARETELSTIVQQYEGLGQEYESDPVAVVARFAAYVGDGSAQTVTATVVQAIQSLAVQGKLTDSFLEHFGMDDDTVERYRRQSQENNRLARIEARQAELDAKAEEERTSAANTQQQQTLIAEYNSQFSNILTKNPELNSLSAEELHDLRVQLLTTSRAKGGIDLEDAYDIIFARQQRENAAKQAAESVTRQKKQKTRVITGKSQPGSPAKGTPVDPNDLDAVIRNATRAVQEKRGVHF